MAIHRQACHLVALTLILSGCASSGSLPPRLQTRDTTPPQDLSADPSRIGLPEQQVTANREENVANTGTDAATGNAENPAGPVTIGRTDLLGGWKVSAGNDTCELFMSLTGWVGGYRAVTKGCASDMLAAIQAWNLNDQEILLLNADGDTLARLYATTKIRFNGQTDDSVGVAIFR